MYFSYTLSLFPMNRFFSLYVKATNMNREFTVEKEPVCAVQWWHWRPQCGVYVISQNHSRVILCCLTSLFLLILMSTFCRPQTWEKNSLKGAKNRALNPLEWRFFFLCKFIWGKSDCSAEHSQVTGTVVNETSYLVPELVHPRIPGQQEIFLKDTFQTS